MYESGAVVLLFVCLCMYVCMWWGLLPHFVIPIKIASLGVSTGHKVMRRSFVAFRGAKGYNWYTKFQEKGADGFRKFTPPTPFDWSKPIAAAAGITKRPTVYFDLSIEKEPLGRVEFELAADILPKTVENFVLLSTGKGENNLSYKGSIFHAVSKNNVIMGGDVIAQDGTGNHSAFKAKHFADENFIIPHSHKYLLSMASIGIDTNGSQFYIGLAGGNSNRHLNGRCVVFGRVIKGEKVVDEISNMFTTRLKPAREVRIEECGVL